MVVGGKRLLVCRTKEGFSVIDDGCTHEKSPLRGGWLNRPVIECPLHGARFNVRTVAVEGDDILAELQNGDAS